MIIIEDLIGKDMDWVREYLKGDVSFRITKLDGYSIPITADYKVERLNLEVENGLVTHIYYG